MAMKHRKLFLTNQTVDCSDICDPSCPYGCYPYPDFYFIPPPPPPPASASQGHHVAPYVIIVLTLLASSFLLLGYYAIFVKNCLRRRRFQPPSPSQSDAGDEDFLDENRGPTIDHPIWYIATVGLGPSIINSITVIKYAKGDSLIDGTDCSVCLNEFQEDETLRLLPKCNHAFHIPCIDTWLRSHTNCPLCRAGIVSNAVNNPLSDSITQNPHDSGSIEATQIEISEIDGDLDCENRGETEDEVEFPQIDGEIENSKPDLASNGDGIDSGMAMENGMEIHRLIRSVSMDSAADINIIESGGSSVNVENHDVRDSRMIRVMGGSSVSQSLHKRPVSMKRSFSCGGRSFLSRNYRRSPKAIILPL